jgi:hypothetical protein
MDSPVKPVDHAIGLRLIAETAAVFGDPISTVPTHDPKAMGPRRRARLIGAGDDEVEPPRQVLVIGADLEFVGEQAEGAGRRYVTSPSS